jgi:hypothetical protein
VQRHTFFMAFLSSALTRGVLFFGVCALALPAAADEIHLKDGKKITGEIVGYEGNMFKVKTDFGYVLVEKDKIASIVPTTPAKPKSEAKPAGEAVGAANKVGTPAAAPMKESKAAEIKHEKAAEKSSKKDEEPAKPAAAKSSAAGPAATVASAANPPATATSAFNAKPAGPPAAPKEPEPPANREEVQGNTYINYTHGFRMYKAPGWSLLDDARRALPNAIVAMGTTDESTIVVVGLERTKDPLETAAAAVEKRLREAYEDYQRLDRKNKLVGGLAAVQYRYRAKETERGWSGTLVVVAREKDIFTVLGITSGNDDLIQIQENVIARAIASLDFSVH